MTLFVWGLIVIVLFAVWPAVGEVVLTLAGKPTRVLPFLLFYTIPGSVVALALWLVGFAIYWWGCR